MEEMLREGRISGSSQGDGDSEVEYSSDSGKGGSEGQTPPDSVNEAETKAVQWQLCPAYSSYTSYSKSLGRILPGHAMIYEFEIPQSLVGRLIGRYGAFVNKIKVLTGANIIVKRHFGTGGIKICAVEGICSEIDEALNILRERFPIKRFPNVTLAQVNPHGDQIPPSISFLPSNNKLNLIEGVVNDVSVSCVVSLDHIFVQQPTHPTYPALSRLHQALKSLYEQPVGAPKLSRPFNTGVICVAQIKENEWLRSEVVAVDEEKDQVTTRLVDVGGYVHCPIDSLRQIRVDFVTIPFQSTECRLANVTPISEEGWSEEALNFFKILVHGHVLQANVVGYSAKDNITLIHLYKLNGNHSHLFINEELVNHGYAKLIEQAEYYTPQDEIQELCQTFDDSVDLSSGITSPIEPEFSTPSWGDCSSSDEQMLQDATQVGDSLSTTKKKPNFG